MKEVHALLQQRQAEWEPLFFAKHGFFMTFDDFVTIKTRKKSLLDCLTLCRSVLRSKVCGEDFWKEREVQLRLSEGHRLVDPKRRQSIALVWHIRSLLLLAGLLACQCMIMMVSDDGALHAEILHRN
jgi:hypothetical protein